MIRTRSSGASSRNPELHYLAGAARGANSQWVARAGIRTGSCCSAAPPSTHFRSRVAQSHLRSDLLAELLVAGGHPARRQGRGHRRARLAGRLGDPRDERRARVPLRAFDDPDWYPNVAVLRFAGDDGALRSGVAPGAGRAQHRRPAAPGPRVARLRLGCGRAGEPAVRRPWPAERGRSSKRSMRWPASSSRPASPPRRAAPRRSGRARRGGTATTQETAARTRSRSLRAAST